MPPDPSVEVERFARCYVDGPKQLPPNADTRKSDRGYYFRLGLDSIDAADATSLISKANEQFDVELVDRVRTGDIVKERVYIDHPDQAPDPSRVEEGERGGLYYETEERVSAPGSGPAEQRDVAVIAWSDVEIGDDIVYEQPNGNEVFAEITSIEERDDQEDIIHVVVDGEETRAAPGKYTVDEVNGATEKESSDEKSEGSVTTSTDGVSSARYSREDSEDEELDWTNVEKAFDADVFHVYAADDDDTDYDNDLLGVGVDMPNHDVYVDWRNESFPDELDHSHVSIYGSVSDLEQATGNRTEYIGTVGEDDSDIAKTAGGVLSEVGVYLSKDGSNVWTYYIGPQGGEGWINVETGEKRYQKQRPGEAPEGGDGYGDWLGDGWEEPPEDLTELQEGQIVEFQDPNGEYHEGEVDILDPDGGYAKISGDSIDGLVGEHGDDELTAVEEVEMPTAFDQGEKVHLMTEDLPEEHPDYMDEEAVIGDVTVIDGDAYYEVEDKHGTLINEFAEDELEDLVLDGTGGGNDGSGILDGIEDDFDGMEENLGIDDEGEDDDADVSVSDFGEGDQIMYEDGDGNPQTGVIDSMFADYAVTEDGSYVGDDPDDLGAMLDGIVTGPEPVDGSDDVPEAEPGDMIEVESQVGTFEAEVVDVQGSDYIVDDGESEFEVFEEDIVGVSEGSGDSDGSASLGLDPGDTLTYETYGQEYDVEVLDPTLEDDSILVETKDGDEMTVYEDEVVDIHGEDESADGSDEEPSSFADQLDSEDPDDLTPEEQDFLDEYDIEPGASFMHSGMETIVTGADSMMQDGSPSHVEVYVPESDVTTVLHPNSVPDHATADGEADEEPSEGDTSGTGPDPDAVDSAVAESDTVDDAFHPDQASETKPLSSIGANHGNSMAAKEVAVMADGSDRVVTNLDHPDIELEDGERQMAGYEALKHIDPERTLDHSADLEEGWFANEVAPGVDAVDATPEMKAAVSDEDFAEMAATQIIIGNADAHQNNIRVDDNGDLYPFDLDRSAGDVHGDWVGAFGHYDDTLDRMFGELDKSAKAIDVQMDRQAVINHAEEIASGLGEEEIEQIRTEAADHNSSFAETIVSNITALRNGEVSP